MLWKQEVMLYLTRQWFFHRGDDRVHYHGDLILLNVPFLGILLVTIELTFLIEVCSMFDSEHPDANPNINVECICPPLSPLILGSNN